MDTPEEPLAQKDAEVLRAELGHLRNELSAMAAKVRGIVADKGQETYSRARATATSARQRAEVASDSASRMIEDRPLVSVIAAFFIGVVVGATVLAAVPPRQNDGR
jgi:ElaB/YqjD/DUF883 family membrane-anchored ribosome-binding protein